MKNRLFSIALFLAALNASCSLVMQRITNGSLPVGIILNSGFKRVPGMGMGGSVLDVGPEGSWFSEEVSMPTVVYDGELYRMLFVGAKKTSDPGYPYQRLEALGLAISNDGIHWNVSNDAKPVFEPGSPGSFDAKGISHPFLLRVDDRYWLWYVGLDGRTAGDIGLIPPHVRVERIGLASSNDCIHWTRENAGKPVLDTGNLDDIDSIQIDSPSVLKIKDRFLMWYSAYNGRHSIGLAESPDGIHWTKLNGGKSLLGLTGIEQLGPSVYFDGRRYLLLYQNNLGRTGEGPSWNTYAATSANGTKWKSALDGNPVLGPPRPGGFDQAGVGMNYAVHPSQIIIVGRTARVWYTGEEPGKHQRIGLMEATQPLR